MNKTFKTTLFLIFLFAVCGYAEYTFDNDKEIQEKEHKRDMEREEAKKALEKIRFGAKVGFGAGAQILGEDIFVADGEAGIMINAPLSLLNVLNLPSIGSGNFLIATELNLGFRYARNHGKGYWDNYTYHNENTDYDETYLNIPLMLQYVSFFFPTSDIKAHLLPSPKRHFLMHLKTIAEAGAFIEIPLKTISERSEYTPVYGYRYYNENYKDRNFFDLGVVVGGAFQLESITLGVRVAVSYMDFGGSALVLQGKAYLGYLF